MHQKLTDDLETAAAKTPEDGPIAVDRRDANRSTLRCLLTSESRGDRSWLRNHPANARFLSAARAAGVDTDAWLAPMSRTLESPVGPCRVHIEIDPLHVLQMENYFSTCLSEGDVNAFATILNAVEANKRVIYVYQQSTVVGRKLIVLTHTGQLVGFRTYASFSSNLELASQCNKWLKSALDQFCRDFAASCHATLHYGTADSAEIDSKEAEKIPLFTKWYDDGPEPFECKSDATK